MRSGSTPSSTRSSRAAGASFDAAINEPLPAGEDHFGLRVALGEKRRFNHSLALIEDDLAPRLANQAVDGPPRTMIPKGGGISAAGRGKRFSKGAAAISPSGVIPTVMRTKIAAIPIERNVRHQRSPDHDAPTSADTDEAGHAFQ